MNIKAIIRKKGFTLEELGAKMAKPMSQQSMSALLKDDANPSINKLREIADILGVTLSELVSDDDCDFIALISDAGKTLRFNSKRELSEWLSAEGGKEEGRE